MRRISYRAWMTILLGLLVAMVPLAIVLMRQLPEEGVEAKRLWLRWAGVYLLVVLGVLVALVWVVLKEVRQSLEQFRKAHREAFDQVTQQIREEYRRKRERTSRNGRNGQS